MASGGAPCCAIAPGARSTLNTTNNPVAKVFIFLPQPIQFVNHKGLPAQSWKSRDQNAVRFMAFIVATLMQFRVRRNVSGGLMFELARCRPGRGRSRITALEIIGPSA